MIAPTVCMFPFTDVSPSRLAVGFTFFNEIILYKLRKGQSQEILAALPEPARLRLVEASFYDDDAELDTVFSGFAQMAKTYRDPESLAILRGRIIEDDLEESGARLMSAIRGKVYRHVRKDPDREAEIFLHFAEMLDRQNGEVEDILADADAKEVNLSRIMGVDADDELAEAGLSRLKTGRGRSARGRTDFMPQRLAAWARFHNAFGQPDWILATDQPEAAAALDLHLARKLGAGREISDARTTEILEPFLEIRGVIEGGVLPGAADDMRKLLEKVVSRSWKKDEISGLRAEAADIVKASAVQDAGEDDREFVLTGYLMPGRDLKSAFAAAAGLLEPDKNSKDYSGPVLVIDYR